MSLRSPAHHPSAPVFSQNIGQGQCLASPRCQPDYFQGPFLTAGFNPHPTPPYDSAMSFGDSPGLLSKTKGDKRSVASLAPSHPPSARPVQHHTVYPRNQPRRVAPNRVEWVVPKSGRQSNGPVASRNRKAGVMEKKSRASAKERPPTGLRPPKVELTSRKSMYEAKLLPSPPPLPNNQMGSTPSPAAPVRFEHYKPIKSEPVTSPPRHGYPSDPRWQTARDVPLWTNNCTVLRSETGLENGNVVSPTCMVGLPFGGMTEMTCQYPSAAESEAGLGGRE